MSFSLIHCSKPKDANEVLMLSKQLLKENNTVHYQYKSFWDNKFNESSFRDSTKMVYSKVNTNIHGFIYSSAARNFSFIYDGKSYSKIDHKEKQIVNYNEEKVSKDSAYFDHQMVFFAHPNELLDQEAFDLVIDTIINEKKYFAYKNRQHSKNEDNESIVRDRYYFIEIGSNLIKEIKNVTMIDKDTAQIISYTFDNYQFEKESIDFGNILDKPYAHYSTIQEADESNERYNKLIQVGEKLVKKSYEDISNNLITLYGNKQNKTLVMFSFIGCGGCEYAMREMKKKEFKIQENIDLYYSSPNDKQTTLQAYLERKEFPFTGFSKESKMNDHFSVFSFPTFVLIDSNGEVENVTSGYQEEVEAILFE